MDPPWPPPELIDDVIADILLHLPPDEPQYLFRASLVCKPWRRLLTDAAFLRRYRRFHGTPPLLGFFFMDDEWENRPRPCFTPTTSPSPFRVLNCRPWYPLDYRHGRVLFRKWDNNNYTIWDPIADELVEELPEPEMRFRYISQAVLCAMAGCDHRDCHGEPFLVVRVVKDGFSTKGFAHVYSSRVGSWGTWVSVLLGAGNPINLSRSTVVGDQVYFMLQLGARIIKYDLAKHHLSAIDPPEWYYEGISLMPTKDGLLGIAAIRGSNLHLWSRKLNSEGVEAWMQCRVIELQTLVPPVDTLLKNARVIGFAEGVHVIIMSTDDGVFIIDLNSERARKVRGPGIYNIAVPFMSFYTPGQFLGIGMVRL
ncbi:unnamed protein product [Urochloa decumbens]|uniref:F-box domain-containing protein n=1 Tax=Urochloa decumbens TaxID=240449 RepID=A0ABC9FMQ1_9POAL